MSARDRWADPGHVLPAIIGNRIRGAATRAVVNHADDRIEVESRITFVARGDLSLESVVVNGEAVIGAIAAELVRGLEHEATNAFAPMLAAREQDLREQLATMTARARLAEGLVDAIRDAWEIEGPAPEVHRRAQRDLRRSWPVLAHAVARISEHERPGAAR